MFFVFCPCRLCICANNYDKRILQSDFVSIRVSRTGSHGRVVRITTLDGGGGNENS